VYRFVKNRKRTRIALKSQLTPQPSSAILYKVQINDAEQEE